eukprot:364536-Chlamydomonas_euryale.AAC.21
MCEYVREYVGTKPTDERAKPFSPTRSLCALNIAPEGTAAPRNLGNSQCALVRPRGRANTHVLCGAFSRF